MNRDVAKLEEVMRLEARVGKLENEIAKLVKRIERLEKERRPLDVVATKHILSDERWP